MKIHAYYELAKPGIIYGNAVSAAAGFFLASAGNPDFAGLVLMLLGLSLVIGSGCVWNNYIDRDIDARMERTKNRAFVRHLVSVPFALSYGTLLGVLGIALLLWYANALAALVAVIGFFFYVFIYSLWGKRVTPYGAHVGAIAGAVPPVVGYTAVSGRLDLAALILFLMLVFWQMPHFFAIALRRKSEYQAAGIPVLPAVRTFRETRTLIIGYIIAFTAVACLLASVARAGLWYVLASFVLGAFWLAFALARPADEARWAKRVFLASLVALLGICLVMSVDARPLPAHFYPQSAR